MTEDSKFNDALERLKTPVQFLKGVGPHRAEKLAKLGIHNALDLIFFFPRDYQDMREVVSIDRLEEEIPSSIIGHIEESSLRNTGPGRSILGVLIRQDELYLRAVWFNQPFLKKKFTEGQRVLVSGNPKLNGLRWEMSHPTVETLSEGEVFEGGRLMPIYPLTEGIRQPAMRKIVSNAIEEFVEDIGEVLPEPFLKDHNLIPVHQAIRLIHDPLDKEEKEQARKRFIYQELFVLQLALAMRRNQLTARRHAKAITVDNRIDDRIRKLIPFELTEDQNNAVLEVCKDLKQETPMNRLLQGDVGTGKTIVAVYAMLAAVASGLQAGLMAPTEVLARQHVRTMGQLLAKAKVKIGLLTGSLTEKQRREVLAETASGEIDLLIGTQAMIATKVEFSDLGLVIIDEQHKFGVKQRAALRGAGTDPHYLVMTATPIPRTVAMTLFGDLDVSTIRQGPPGRQAVHTYIGSDEQREKWWSFFRKKLREGHQGYVVAPLVDDSENTEAASAAAALENLANGELEAFRLGLLHGRMSTAEKEATMKEFRDGKIQVLISTTVIEVGVDIPNSVLMTIEGGERFGLAQLHQLRGRISRGNHPGYICVFADPKTEHSQERLKAFAGTTDGFELAEFDFNLRGPGDLFGLKQHGIPPLRIADLQRDGEILENARKDARSIIEEDPMLTHTRWDRLRRMVLIRYGKSLDLSDLG